MTIYSGFASRKLEQKYNGLLVDIIAMLSQLVITYVERDKIQPFEKSFLKTYQAIERLDSLKHIQPKFSNFLKPLSQHIFLEDEPSQYAQTEIEHSRGVNKPRRPLTSNNFTQERRHSIQFQRKTIHVLPPKTNTSFQQPDKEQKKRTRYFSFSSKHADHPFAQKIDKQKQFQIPNSMTMEQLMEKNRLVQRKMTLFRKKRQTNNKISRIPELDEQQDSNQFS